MKRNFTLLQQTVTDQTVGIEDGTDRVFWNVGI